MGKAQGKPSALQMGACFRKMSSGALYVYEYFDQEGGDYFGLDDFVDLTMVFSVLADDLAEFRRDGSVSLRWQDYVAVVEYSRARERNDVIGEFAGGAERMAGDPDSATWPD